MNELDTHFKRSKEWTLTPMQRPRHDFVGDLFDRYMKDLEMRHKKLISKTATPCDLLRKTVTFDILANLVGELEA